MSYSLTPYFVDLEQLRRSIGSKDETLLASVAAADPVGDDDESGHDEAGDEAGEIPLQRTVRHLVMGEPLDARSAHQYGYALKELCSHLGEAVPERDCWESIHWEVLEATGMEAVLEQTGSPVPLPPIADFPAIGHLPAERITEILSKLGDEPLKTAAPTGRKPRRTFRAWLVSRLMARLTRRAPLTGEDLRELLDEYESWLREAAAKQKSLVFFYY